MAIFLAGKAVCYRILAFFCYGKLHFKCESADLFIWFRESREKHSGLTLKQYGIASPKLQKDDSQ